MVDPMPLPACLPARLPACLHLCSAPTHGGSTACGGLPLPTSADGP